MAVDYFTGDSDIITTNISEHYVDKARKLPWRIAPGGHLPDPYHIWLSEVMLQQTTVATVTGYFEKFINRWPTVGDLAAEKESELLAAWAGLGYYARARNLHRCAGYVVDNHGGILPHKESELLKLPGIGSYTAAAIAAIAFGERAVIVDANIERLITRLCRIETPLPAAKAAIRAAMDQLTPAQRAGDFAQACMDIGATICTARQPKCDLCPVADHCAAFAADDMERYPVKPAKKAKPVRKARFFWIERDGALLLTVRPQQGMLAAMRALPDDDWAAAQDGDGRPPKAGDNGSWTIFDNIVQHSFTHFSLEVDLAVYHPEKSATNIGENIATIENEIANACWWPLAEIADAGLPTLYAKAVKWKLRGRI